MILLIFSHDVMIYQADGFPITKHGYPLQINIYVYTIRMYLLVILFIWDYSFEGLP